MEETTSGIAIALFFMVIVGAPIFLGKMQQRQVDWVGYHVGLRGVSVGIS